MKSLERTAIQCRPMAGARLEECISEAVIVAAENQCNVEFIHNGTTYTLYWGDLASCCIIVAKK